MSNSDMPLAKAKHKCSWLHQGVWYVYGHSTQKINTKTIKNRESWGELSTRKTEW